MPTLHAAGVALGDVGAGVAHFDDSVRRIHADGLHDAKHHPRRGPAGRYIIDASVGVGRVAVAQAVAAVASAASRK